MDESRYCNVKECNQMGGKDLPLLELKSDMVWEDYLHSEVHKQLHNNCAVIILALNDI